MERSVSTILGNLGSLDHFRHLVNLLYQSVKTKDGSKIEYDEAKLCNIDS